MPWLVSIAFDARGAAVAAAFFLGLLLVLLVVMAVNLRRDRLGPLRLSRRVRVVGFSVLALAYLATLYHWLFWRTFYELRVSPDAERVELTVLVPERTIGLGIDRIAAIRRAPGARPGFARLVVETRDGRRFRSPDRAAAEIRRLHASLPALPAGRNARPESVPERPGNELD